MKRLYTYAVIALWILSACSLCAQQKQSLADSIVVYAKSFIGTPYSLGAPGPKAFDCSSYTSYVFRHFGIDIPAYSKTQFNMGRKIERYSDLQKGDLVFFGTRAGARTIGHVGIIVEMDLQNGSFYFIHASVTKGVVIENSHAPYFHLRYSGARRFIPDLKE